MQKVHYFVIIPDRLGKRAEFPNLYGDQMKSKKLLLLVTVCLLYALCCTACAPEEIPWADIKDYYTLTDHGDFTYSYSIKDKQGNVLYEQEKVSKAPETTQPSSSVFGLVTQTGTGLSTNWAVYCDVENSKVSETFNYVLGANDKYVVYAQDTTDGHFIIVQDIFDIETYFTKTKLRLVSSVASDFAIACRFDDAGNAIVTYLSGEEYTETETTITIP